MFYLVFFSVLSAVQKPTRRAAGNHLLEGIDLGFIEGDCELVIVYSSAQSKTDLFPFFFPPSVDVVAFL